METNDDLLWELALPTSKLSLDTLQVTFCLTVML